MTRSCAECKYTGHPGRHYVDPAEGRTDFTADELADLEPYYVRCPTAAAEDERERLETVVAEHARDEQTAAFKAAKEILKDAAAVQATLNGNTVRHLFEQAQVPGSVIGAAFSWAVRTRLIEVIGMVPSTDEGTHKHRIFNYRSLVYGQRRAG